MGMLKTVAQAWKVAEIRSKMVFTLLMLVIFRIGSNIPVPNIDRTVLTELFAGETGLFDLFDFFVAKLAMPVGGIFLCLLMQRMGRQRVTDMITNHGTLRLGIFPQVYYIMVTKVVPLLIALIFISELM